MNSKDFLKEGFVEDAHMMHQDHEVQMAREECYHAAENAITLHKLLRNISEQQGLEGWVSAKITLAGDYLKTVREYLEYELMTAASEQPMLPIAEGSGSKEKQKTPYRDINSPEYRKAAEKQKEKMDKEKAAEPGKKLLGKIKKQEVEEEANDYFKRRKDEEDRIAGTKAPAKRTPQQTDYAKRRAQEKKTEQGVAEGSDLDQQAMAVADKLTSQKNLQKLQAMAHDSTVYRALDRYFAKNNIPENIYNRVAHIVFQKINQQGVAEGMLDSPGEQDSAVAQAIIRRILLQRTDLLAKHGPEKVGAAVDEVADFVGDVDEIGSSDVSGWVRRVEQMLGNMQQGVAEAGPAQGEYSRVLTALRLYYPRFEIEELNTPDWHRVIANKANVTPEYAGQVIDDFVKASQPDEEENLDWMDDTNDVREGVAEGSSCNMTMEGKSYPMHGLKKCPGYKSNIEETTAGSVAGVVNPTPKNKAKVGTLFGGTYKQKKAKA